MLHIFLKDVNFFSRHGVHAEEALTGGWFQVNICVSFFPKNIPVVHLDQTINYAGVFQLVKERMQQPSALLETLATEIAEAIIQRFSLAEEVDISIEKLNTPIVGFDGTAGVRYQLKRSEL